MRIFMCYASEQHNLAARLAAALRGQAHEVFLDRDDLPPGHSFDDRIRQAIKKCHLFIFLISPHAVEQNAYTLSELKFAREKWPNPGSHVLPVMAVETPFDTIPGYLSNLTILRPEGNLVAEVLAETDRLQKQYRFRHTAFSVAPIVVIFLLFIVGVYTLGVERVESSFRSVLTAFGIVTPHNAPELGLTSKLRPIPPGVSISNDKRTAGTVCCSVWDQEGRRLLLTAEHAVFGDPGTPVYQPGLADGGDEAARIGQVLKLLPAQPGVMNTAAGALVELAPGVRSTMTAPGLGPIRGVASSPRVGERVRALGRTSGLVAGEIKTSAFPLGSVRLRRSRWSV
jgi:TIR domain